MADEGGGGFSGEEAVKGLLYLVLASPNRRPKERWLGGFVEIQNGGAGSKKEGPRGPLPNGCQDNYGSALTVGGRFTLSTVITI